MAKIQIGTAKAGFEVTLIKVGNGNPDSVTVGIKETRNNVVIIDHGKRRMSIGDVLSLRVTEEGELRGG